jgi:hypothetical protein
VRSGFGLIFLFSYILLTREARVLVSLSVLASTQTILEAVIFIASFSNNLAHNRWCIYSDQHRRTNGSEVEARKIGWKQIFGEKGSELYEERCERGELDIIILV